MIVRLKADYKIFTFYMTEVFQFYDSPIKRVIQCNFSPKNKGFNSMIVRLKE